MKIKMFSLVLLAFVIGCSSPQKLMEQQRYDEAILKSSERINAGSENKKNLLIFQEAYHTANQKDHDRIIQLKASGEPDIWPAVYWHYAAIQKRIVMAQKLPEAQRKKLDLPGMTVEDELNAAKNKATHFLFASATMLLEKGGKAAALEAFNELSELQRIHKNYPGLDAAMRKALLQSADNILIGFRNNTSHNLPAGFADKVLDFKFEALKEAYPTIDLQPQAGKRYDYQLVIQLDEIIISPEKREEVRFVEKNNQTEARITDFSLEKSATLIGQLRFIYKAEDRLVYSAPFNVSSVFKYNFARAAGDEKAFSSSTADLVKKPALPFPADGSLVNDAAINLQQTVAQMLGL
ncbi:MAG: hypothetical protein PF694_12280 [Bacteroidetes bacterium]|jgi:hypothetical protein|nr:hypothetical protein [Bacteroidota bacterium]